MRTQNQPLNSVFQIIYTESQRFINDKNNTDPFDLIYKIRRKCLRTIPKTNVQVQPISVNMEMSATGAYILRKINKF